MKPFTVQEWKDIMAKLPANDITRSVEEILANRILFTLNAYGPVKSGDISFDVAQLSNAMLAYAKLLQENGVVA